MCKCQSANLVYTSRFMRKVFLTNKLLNCDCRLRIDPSAADAEWPRACLI